MSKKTLIVIRLTLFITCLTLFSFAQPPATPLKNSYTKIERLIKMRDGVQLFTAIYIPIDTTELHPILITRTPYSCQPYGEDKFAFSFGNPVYAAENYIVVYQDVRGRYMSEGVFTEVTPHKPNKAAKEVDESSDTYDTIEWLLKNIHGNNGKVGLHGVSYPGFYATAALPNAHPAIKAVSPQAPVTDEFEGDDAYHRGAFFLLDNVDFMNFFDHPRTGPQKDYPEIDTSFRIKDAYQYYLKLGPIKHVNDSLLHNQSVIWNEYLAHNTNDEYWQARNIRKHLTNIRPAVLVVGGWFDAEDMFGALKTYEAIEKQNKKNSNYLLMGPWTHGGWARRNFSSYATYQFGVNTNEKFSQMEPAFFNYYLKEKGNWNQAEATVFFTGINQWKTFDSWPAPQTTSQNIYFANNSKLTYQPSNVKKGSTTYVSDPANPVPYTSITSGNRDQNYLGADQRFLKSRPDVVSFTTEVLTGDLTLAGPVAAKLFVTTTGTDADFIVKIIDVLPDTAGTQQLVRAEVIRGKFRNSFSKPEPFVPGKVTEINLALNDVAHCFRAGHKIMIKVQSSWFPITDRNPQKFMNIAEASEADFQKATIGIEHNKRYPSRITCTILPN